MQKKSTVSGKTSFKSGGEAWENSYWIMEKERKKLSWKFKKKKDGGKRSEVEQGKNVPSWLLGTVETDILDICYYFCCLKEDSIRRKS